VKAQLKDWAFFYLLDYLSFLLDQKRNKKIKAVKTFLENYVFLRMLTPNSFRYRGSSDTGFPFTSE
jgi:hypothetical protein